MDFAHSKSPGKNDFFRELLSEIGNFAQKNTYLGVFFFVSNDFVSEGSHRTLFSNDPSGEVLLDS